MNVFIVVLKKKYPKKIRRVLNYVGIQYKNIIIRKVSIIRTVVIVLYIFRSIKDKEKNVCTYLPYNCARVSQEHNNI